MSRQEEPPIEAPPRGRLRTAVGKYLPDLIFGANDGVITTLAVVSGVVGASLSTSVILILGFANLLADGISMGASNVLSRRSDVGEDELPRLKEVASHGTATFIGFVLAGVVPLLAYLLPWFDGDRFSLATVLALVTLFVVGAGRAFFTQRGWLASGLEMLVIGALAAGVAYGIGALGAAIITVRAAERLSWLSRRKRGPGHARPERIRVIARWPASHPFGGREHAWAGKAPIASASGVLKEQVL